MDGCGWCERFKPTWQELKNKSSYDFYECESNDLDKSKEAKDIEKKHGYNITGFPTIFIQINNIYHKYEGNRTKEHIIEFINKYKDNDNDKDNDKDKDNEDNNNDYNINNNTNNISLFYFYMNGCGWCNKFKPVWDELKKIKYFKFKEIERNEIDKSKYAEDIISNNYEIKSFPSIFIKINNKVYKYEGERTQKDILKFINNNLDDKENNNQSGGGNNVNYRNKYKKYKKMYSDILNKYNKLAKKLNQS
jgi:glutaredoxin